MSAFFGAFGITFTPHKRENPILEEVSFELEKGEILALIGPNGSGKTTLLKAISGLHSLRGRGCSGVVQFKGSDFLSLSARERAQRVAYVGSELNPEFPLRAEDVVLLGRTSQGGSLLHRMSEEDRQQVQWAMERTFCWSFRHRELASLSGGEKQLVALARALVQGAKILLIDEALSKMDLNHQAQVGKMLRSLAREGWSIVLVAHDLNLASEWASSGILLKNGRKVASGLMSEIITQEKLRLLYPETNLVVAPNPATGTPKIFFGATE